MTELIGSNNQKEKGHSTERHPASMKMLCHSLTNIAGICAYVEIQWRMAVPSSGKILIDFLLFIRGGKKLRHLA
jgi:hypothetical protein